MKRLLLLAALVLFSIPAQAQVDRATLTGTVKDQLGAVISGATVAVTHAGTNVTTRVRTTGEGGEILDVGRARRTIPSAIGRALWLRDGGCRVPGCGRNHHLHAHHIEAWADGGKTSTSNLVLLCPSHHTLVHEGTLFVEIIDGRIAFRNVHGTQLRPSPDRGEGDESFDPWLHTDPEFEQDGTPQWDGSRLDVDEVLSWMLIAEQKFLAQRGLARAA